MTYLVALVAAFIVLAAVAVRLTARRDVRGQVERFHRAREITTTWSDQYAGRPGRSEPADSH